MNNPPSTVIDDLELLYIDLRNRLLIEKGNLVADSVLFTLVSISSNDRLKFLSKSSIDISESTGDNKYLYIEKLGYLDRLYQNNKISLIFTVLGLYKTEEDQISLNLSKLLEFLQFKFFDLDETNKVLSSKEKAILFSLITMRCFGETKAMDLSASADQAIWFDIISKSVVPFLKAENIITETTSIFPNSAGNETPVSYVMRRQNSLSKRTASVYSSPGSTKYFLNLQLNNPPQVQALLAYLFERILPKNVTFSQIQRIITFLESNFNEYIPLLQGEICVEDDMWTEIIRKSLEQIILK